MNVTPLVDVVLVLLIIFMVIAPELEHGTRVELPSINNPDPTADPDEQKVMVTVAADGQIFLEDELITKKALVDRLIDIHKKERAKRLWLKGDASRPYGELRDIFKEAQKAGFPGVKLLVGAREGADEGKKE
ncbi:MAG: biopolymer transporter ExbD [Deltaproteobacteria bacterium]|nr:MAG: biopolymer transporter ExbD [Deltaproteobacteria bacterium]